MVQTVLGPVAAEQLGLVLMHEHLVFGPENSPGWVALPHRDELATSIADELRRVREENGLGCFVDLSAIACSRDVALGRAVAKQSGVAVVMCTGFWEGVSYPEWVNSASIDEIRRVLVRELREGIDDTGVRAGVIKVATGKDAVTRPEANALRAVARAHAEVGAGIVTHTGLGTMGWEQLAIFEQEGVDLSRTVIGHLDSQTDQAYFEYVLRRGANVAFDRIGRGRPFQPDDGEKADLVAALVKAGWANRIVLAHDGARWFTMQGGFKPERPPYSYVLTTFAEMLRGRGVSDADIRTMLVENPARILAF